MPSPSLLKASNSKSLTPQRKHHKLLKDGSGAEVWPEAIESFFVQGLREYWQSPWANYSQSRGRSRWRNQYLVDYLSKNGINRSKKQVASHIQVLRNMWKGQPEFYLVAGGDETPTSESAVKVEDPTDGSLIPFDHEDREYSPPSPSTASPNYSPPDSQSDFPPSPPGSSYPYSLASPFKDLPDLNNANLSLHPQNTVFTTSLPTSFSSYPMDITTSYQDMTPPLLNQYYPLDNLQPILPQTSDPPRTTNTTTNFFYPPGPARATAISLTAHGMTPFSVNLEALTSQSPTQLQTPSSPLSPFSSSSSALALRIRLGITASPSDGTGLRRQHPMSPAHSGNTILPQLHGFNGSVSLSRVWSHSGKCLTRVYNARNGGGATCVSTESSALEITSVEAGTAIAVLPDSALAKCRWYDKAVQTRISQEIIVDNESILYLVYELDRNRGPLPSAELIGFHPREKPVPSPSSFPSPASYPSSNTVAYAQTSLNQSGSNSYYPSPMTTLAGSGQQYFDSYICHV